MYKQLGRRFWGYTYQDLEKDLEIFARAFPETMELKTLGKTADKREIYCFILGRADAGEKIFLFGAIHGREYMTSQLLMEQTAEFLTKLYREETYKGYSYKELLRGKAVYVVPMANPDGVTISQQGPRGIRDPELQKQVWKIGEREGGRMPCGPYYRKWKANARGVDLNRNFQAFWEEYHDLKGQPSREGYKGQAPEDQEESKAKDSQLSFLWRSHLLGFRTKRRIPENMPQLWRADTADHRIRPAGRLGLPGPGRLQGLGRKRKEDPQPHH